MRLLLSPKIWSYSRAKYLNEMVIQPRSLRAPRLREGLIGRIDIGWSENIPCIHFAIETKRDSFSRFVTCARQGELTCLSVEFFSVFSFHFHFLPSLFLHPDLIFPWIISEFILVGVSNIVGRVKVLRRWNNIFFCSMFPNWRGMTKFEASEGASWVWIYLESWIARQKGTNIK